MKKLIALTLMVACLVCFSLGCPGKKPATPAPGPATSEPADNDAGKTTDGAPAEVATE